jgi:Zn-dependent M28 family amino/carboxypeptidase
MIPYLHQHRPRVTPLTAAHRALAQQLRRDVEILATDIGPRGTFAPDRYALAASFLESSLTNSGYTVARHRTVSLDVEAFNLEATLRGTSNPDRILIVGAHYDSIIDCPAANDNASGVAGVLAIARALHNSPQPCTIRFVLFANEEPPHFNLDSMGSQDYARECRRRGDDIRGMVCLETIGFYTNAPNSQSWPIKGLGFVLPAVGDFITFVGPDSSKRLIKMAAAAFEAQSAFPLLAAAAPKAIDQINWSDHRGFNEVGYEAFMVTDTAPLRYKHYHQPTDTPEKLDYESMARVVDGLIGMIQTLASQA